LITSYPNHLLGKNDGREIFQDVPGKKIATATIMTINKDQFISTINIMNHDTLHCRGKNSPNSPNSPTVPGHTSPSSPTFIKLLSG